MSAPIVERLRERSQLINHEAADTITDLLAALEPFAEVAEYDIGCDEDNADYFRPMSGGYNIAPLPTVGHFRNALAASAKAKAKAVQHDRP